MIEDELRTVFARQEDLAPPVGPVTVAIEAGYRRRYCRRLVWRAGGAAVLVMGLLAGSALAVNWRPAGERTLGVPGQAPSTMVPGVVGRGTASPSAAPVAGRPMNVLLTGVADQAGSSDSLVAVLHVTAAGDRAYLVGVNELVDGGKLRDAYRSGGAAAAGQAATGAVLAQGGVTFDAGVAITLSALSRVITTMGGVDTCRGPGDCTHVTGPDAINFLRTHSLSEGLSLALAALLRMATITDQGRLGQVIQAGGGGVVIDGGGSDVTSLFTRLRGLRDLIQLAPPSSPAAGWAQLKMLFGAGADEYLARQSGTPGD